MRQITLSLQNRTTSLMFVSAIMLISSFVYIELNNQLSYLKEYNTFKAKISTIVVRDSLKECLRGSNKDLNESFDRTKTYLQNLGVIDKLAVIGGEDKIIVSTDKTEIGKPVSGKEILLRYKLLDPDNTASFDSVIDKANRTLCIYIPLKGENEGASFIAKLSFGLGNIQEALTAVYKPALIISLLVALVTVIIGLLLSKSIIGPVKILNNATKLIAEGNLERRIYIDTNDELQELAERFNEMTVSLIRMKERAENANPLTKLPGNIVIREAVERMLMEDKKFVVIHTDLNNFKAFNDKYGLAAGDEAIKINAEILKEAVKKHGNPEDLVGHEGGDDFVLTTSPEKAKSITDYIIDDFDKRIRALYTAEDLNQGYIISTSRQGVITKFPIMSISLSGATNMHRKISSYTEVTHITAEVKKKAKAAEKSIFVLDKRISERETQIT